MIDLNENLTKIGELTGLHLRIAVCMALGWIEQPGGEWLSPDPEDKNKYPTVLSLPPFESDMRWAFCLMEARGLAVIPQSDEEHGWRWLCTDLIAVKYNDQIVLEEKESTAFGDFNPCVSVCRCFLASELVVDYQREQEGLNHERL